MENEVSGDTATPDPTDDLRHLRLTFPGSLVGDTADDALNALAAERERADRAERERDDAYLTIRALTKAGA